MKKIVKFLSLFFLFFAFSLNAFWDELKDNLVNKVYEKLWWQAFYFKWYEIKSYLTWKDLNYLNSLSSSLDTNKYWWKDQIFDYEVYWRTLNASQREFMKQAYDRTAWNFDITNKENLFNWDKWYALHNLLNNSLESYDRNDPLIISKQDFANVYSTYIAYKDPVLSITNEQKPETVLKKLWDWIADTWVYNKWWVWWQSFNKVLASIIPDADKRALSFISYVNSKVWPNWTIQNFKLLSELESFKAESSSLLTDQILEIWWIKVDPNDTLWYVIFRLIFLLNSYFMTVIMLVLLAVIYSAIAFSMSWEKNRNEHKQNFINSTWSFMMLTALLLWLFSMYTKFILWPAVEEIADTVLTKDLTYQASNSN